MQFDDIHKVRRLVSGRPLVNEQSGTELEPIAASLVVTFGILTEFVERVAVEKTSDDDAAREIANNIAGHLRGATSQAQILHAAAQGEPRQVQRRMTT